MPKERNKADDYREKAYAGDTKAMNRSTSGRLLPTGRKKAKQGSWRISEATLLTLAVVGGSIGALLGMQVWHHKTMHKKFKYGLPLILLAQIALIYFINK